VKVLARFSFAHRRVILVVALLATAGAAVYGTSVFDAARPFGFSDSSSESARAYDAIKDATGEQPVPGIVLLVRPGTDVESPAGEAAVRDAARRLADIEGIARVTAPSPQSDLISDDGRKALVEGFLDAGVDDSSSVGEDVESEFSDRPDVVAGGAAVAAQQLNRTTERDLRRIELYAAPFLLLISLIVFRGLVAALIPLLVGGLSIAFTLAALRALTEVMVVDVFALNVVTVLGLGLAIDYSLFMVSRYREEIAQSGATREGLERTVAPVGRMVCFSAATVAGAVASLAVFPQHFLSSTGIGCALVTLLSAAVVLVVVPAVLSTLGERVNALAPPALRRGAGSTLWKRVGRAVLRRPIAITVVVAAVMVLLGIPFLRASLTRADARDLPTSSSARVVDRTVRGQFATDPSSALLVVLPKGGPEPGAVRALASVPGVTAVGHQHSAHGVHWLEAGIKPTSYSDAALDMVRGARRVDWGGPALVSGPSAELLDQRASLKSHLPAAIAIILAVTTIALVLMTGSMVIPVLALIGNTLTVGAALGILVLVFQDDRFESVLSYTGVGALDISVPILLFAVIFGLSTDYGIFLFSRIDEARRSGQSGSRAIAIGLERSGRIITAAALLFAVAMGSFAVSDLIVIKEVAVGTAAAVLIDATLVRALLLPSLMRLCGPRAWWAPAPVKRLARV
jgi:RND superfamily putative drug exporter